MEVFLGEGAPAPMSPTSPNYLATTPRPSFGKRSNGDLLTPTKPTSKQTKRASTVSVMSGLGVPVPVPSPESPPSPTHTARSPSSGSFLTKSKKMYNFFGHRPPSELISNHLAEYFPSAKKRELEKTRHSMLRMSMGPNSRTGSMIAPSERFSFDSPLGSDRRQSLEKRQSPEKRQSIEKRYSVDKSPQSKRSMSISTSKSYTASPQAETISEEENEAENLPRVTLAMDTGSDQPGESGDSTRPSTAGSVESQPPLLPPFEPAAETLSESLQEFSPTETKKQSEAQQPAHASRPRPKSIMLARRGSAGSTRSRVSMMTQLRRNRDRSDTASMLTVDEITADVEHRRASTITFEESDEEEELADVHVPAVIEEPIVPTSDVEGDDGDEDTAEEASDEEDSDDSDDSDEIEEVVEDDHGKAYMSTGCKPRLALLAVCGLTR
jgi:mitogen-activated protein kinase kinase kinase